MAIPRDTTVRRPRRPSRPLKPLGGVLIVATCAPNSIELILPSDLQDQAKHQLHEATSRTTLRFPDDTTWFMTVLHNRLLVLHRPPGGLTLAEIRAEMRRIRDKDPYVRYYPWPRNDDPDALLEVAVILDRVRSAR